MAKKEIPPHKLTLKNCSWDQWDTVAKLIILIGSGQVVLAQDPRSHRTMESKAETEGLRTGQF